MHRKNQTLYLDKIVARARFYVVGVEIAHPRQWGQEAEGVEGRPGIGGRFVGRMTLRIWG